MALRAADDGSTKGVATTSPAVNRHGPVPKDLTADRIVRHGTIYEEVPVGAA